MSLNGRIVPSRSQRGSVRVGWCWNPVTPSVMVLLTAILSGLSAPHAKAQAPAAKVNGHEATSSEAPAILPEHDEASVVRRGLELERERAWADAVRHYESQGKRFPDSKAIPQRLLISRLHHDVNRRYQDHSFLQAVRDLGTGQTLDLYAEILANLETHYVDDIDWSRVLLHGTASLEVALTEERFVNRVLADADPAAIERFRQNVHHELVGRSTATRFDLRANAAYVAGLAHTELGLRGSATVLEYISGAVSTLDSYTRLLSGNQLDEMFSNIEGNFVGLGVELKAEERALKILSVIPDGPADQAGIRAGERIVRVESSRTEAVNPDYAADLLRGPEHSFVSITVASPEGSERELSVQRRRVEVPCVENVHLLDPATGVGYLRLTNFQKTTTRDVERALWDLHRQDMRSLIIDVRGNPGGLLSAAVEVADRFIAEGRIVSTRGRNARENFDYMAHRANTWSVPLAVLIDHDSASASEIFAAAIADSGRGRLVGETSYGKGSVQGIFRMQSAKFGLCLTTARFYSPNGRAINLNGIQPHVECPSTTIAARPDGRGRMTLDREDRVLQTAIEQLSDRNLISRRP